MFEPADGKVLLIIGQDRDSMDAYVEATQVVPGGFMVYTSLADPERGLGRPLTVGSGYQHAQHQVDTYPHSAIQIGLHIVGLLDSVGSGALDDQISLLGRWIRSTDRPVYLRIGYEFDGAHNEYDPVPFVAAWGRIVDGLRSQDVVNVAYVWHSYAAPPYDGHPIDSWYPGDDYVDWAAVSIFGQAYGGEAGLALAHEVADFAEAHGKPLMIGESTPRGQGTLAGQGSWEGWFVPTLAFIAQRDVKAWSYINANWDVQPMWQGKGWGDTRVEADDVVLGHWTEEIVRPRYLNASPTLFSELGA